MNAMHRMRATLDSLCRMRFIYKCATFATGAASSSAHDAAAELSHMSATGVGLFDDDIGTGVESGGGGGGADGGGSKTHKKQLPSYMDMDRDPSQVSAYENDEYKNGVSSVTGTGTGDEFIDETVFDGITDPMPSTKALLQEPSKSIPYKKGRMYKRGTNFINMTEVQRIFVFKHATLYWVKDENEDYPRSRIKFDKSLKNLKIEDKRTVSIKTPRKEYILRCNKKKDMDDWLELFKASIRAHLLNEAWSQRLGQSDKQQQQQHQGLDIANIPSLSEMATQISNGGGTPLSPSSPRSKSDPNHHHTSVVDVDYHHNHNNNNHNNHNHNHNHNKAAAVAVPPTIATVKEEDDDEKGDLMQFEDYTPIAKSPMSLKKVGFNEQANTRQNYSMEFDDEEDIDAEPDEDVDGDGDGDDDGDAAMPSEDVLNVLRQQLSTCDIDIEAAKQEQQPVITDLDAQISPHLRQEPRADDDDVFDVIGVNSDDSEYQFSYGFLRDILYQAMLHSQRKQLHANALKYIAKFLAVNYDDKLALLHTRHIECQQKYSDMLQGNNPHLNGMLAAKKRASRLGARLLHG
mmetsp:Transcript_54227/g.89761  ORF Transcript_54227/g.89761 Transcript_54227/m.89761 type:complete len:574 (+) Transcript_54227:2-1723(+)